MKLSMRTELELLSESDLEKLFHDALRVWREVPFRVQGTNEFFDYLSDYGCKIDGELVRFPEPVIDRVLARINAEKRRRTEQRNRQESRRPESGFSMFTHGQALHCCDLERNDIRPATERDLIEWCHAVDALGNIDRSHPTFIPADVPPGSRDFHAFATIILNSRKPHRVSVYSARMLPFFIEASKIVRGSLEGVRRNHVFATKCWINSPFMITRENIDIAMGARRLLGAPIVFGHMPVAGAATPITLAGSLVQNTAESLALNTMCLAIDDSTCAIRSTAGIMDMRDSCQRQSGPDFALQHLAGKQMNAYLFGDPVDCLIVGQGVAAQTVSPQSMHEKALTTAVGVTSGQRTMGIGSLAFSDVGSPVQLLLDHELGQYYERLFRDVSVDDEHIGLETILQTAPRGAHFLESEQTARFFREECWLPDFVDNRLPLAWMENPSDMIDRARNRARELFLTAENQCPLSEDQRQQIESLIAEADAAVSGKTAR